MYLRAALLLLVPAAALRLDVARPTDDPSFKWFGDYVIGRDVIRLGSNANSHAAIGATNKVESPEWTVEAVVYASCDKNEKPGSSGLALWYTTTPLSEGVVHGGRDYWDGLAIMLDSAGWDEMQKDNSEPGAVRGHMNDGTAQYVGANAAQNAFSLCRLNYRDIKGPIKLRFGYGRGVFAMDVNGIKCFMSDQITLPAGYVGISADSSVSDSFALASLVVRDEFDDGLAAHFPSDRIKPKENAEPVKDSKPAKPVEQDSPVAIKQGDALADLAAEVGHLKSLVQANSDLVAGNDHSAAHDRTHQLVGSASEQVDSMLDKIAKLEDRFERIEVLVRQNIKVCEDSQPGQLASSIETLKGELSTMSVAVASVPEAPSTTYLLLSFTAVQLVFAVFFQYQLKKTRHQKLL